MARADASTRPAAPKSRRWPATRLDGACVIGASHGFGRRLTFGAPFAADRGNRRGGGAWLDKDMRVRS
jgi:hypothetical protein